MSAPIKDEDFPQYFKQGNQLLAFIAKDKMYKIEPIGSNKNPGVTIDHYITRNMVLKHYPNHGTAIAPYEFKQILNKLYKAYIDVIVP